MFAEKIEELPDDRDLKLVHNLTIVATMEGLGIGATYENLSACAIKMRTRRAAATSAFD